jgi:pseudaminic acid synthase
MFQVNGSKIGAGQKPFIIAELSANHAGSIQRAKDTILAAKNAGADAVKIQSYTPDTMTIDSDKSDFTIEQGLWQGYSLYQLYKEASTPFEWHNELFSYAKKINITLFSTPFDETATDMLYELDVPAFKISSFELTDLPLIEYVAKKSKPMFISTGMSSLLEIGEALETCYKVGNKDILLFHCISNYPAELEETSLGDLRYIANHFGIDVGLSDHTISNTAALLAIALGASAIEKHFKLDRRDNGPDSSFSILPDQLKELCKQCNSAFEAVRSKKLKRTSGEEINRKFRRSLYFIKNLKKGQVITEKDIKRIRPGYGLEPKYYDDIIGKVLICDVERGDPVSLRVIQNR